MEEGECERWRVCGLAGGESEEVLEELRLWRVGEGISVGGSSGRVFRLRLELCL